nr:MAG TPA: tail protein [Caudoviricetes sp.]
MIKSIKVTNPKGESLILDLFHPEKSGLIVKSITGLGPPKANINSTDLATADGALYSSARASTRNIVFNLQFMFAPTIEDSRQLTYRYFPLKKLVKIEVETDNRSLETTGYVESNSPDIFSKEESTQISILCLDPFFYDPIPTITQFGSVTPEFEFPFYDDSIAEDALPTLEMGRINLDTRATLDYAGDVDTGIIITIHGLGEVSGILTVYNIETQENMAIDLAKIKTLIGKDFGSGDDIIISTISGNKYVQVLHDGKYTNTISAIEKSADWFQISVGKNLFNFTVTTGVDNLSMSFSYRNAYGGI